MRSSLERGISVDPFFGARGSLCAWLGRDTKLFRKTQKQYTNVSVLAHDVQTALLEISLWDTFDHQPRACSKFVGQVCPHACASAIVLLATAPSRPAQDERVQQAVLAIGKMEMASGNSLTNLKIEVLSCHTSLRDRGAILDIGVALEQLQGISGVCKTIACTHDAIASHCLMQPISRIEHHGAHRAPHKMLEAHCRCV